MVWTEEKVTMLKQLWQEGLSASRIAAKMGGITRNAVIGKVHRLGLSGRGAPRVRADRKPPVAGNDASARTVNASARAVNASARAVAARPAGDEADKTPLMVDVAAIRDNMCKWPIGDPGQDGFAFCGHPRLSDGAYCKLHAAMAFKPVRQQSASAPDDTADASPDDERKLAG